MAPWAQEADMRLAGPSLKSKHGPRAALPVCCPARSPPMYSAMKALSARTTSSRSTNTYSPVCSDTARDATRRQNGMDCGLARPTRPTKQQTHTNLMGAGLADQRWESRRRGEHPRLLTSQLAILL